MGQEIVTLKLFFRPN